MMDNAALTEHQKMILQGGISAADRGRVAAFIESFRGKVARDRWPSVARILQLVDQKGEARLEARGIPADKRQGAALEIIAGGPKWRGANWTSWGLIARWQRGPENWILVSVERLELGGGPDKATLHTTAEQDALAYDHHSREAYDIRARFSGDQG